MFINEQLYQAYLEELHELDLFRGSYAEKASAAFQESAEDPYTKRLTEALAFFMARNRLQSEKQVNRLYQRLFHQYFSFLSAPLPAMSLLQVVPSLDLPEKTEIKEGTEVRLSTADGRRAHFQTLNSLFVLPVRAGSFHVTSFKGSGKKVKLQYQSSYSRPDQIENFSFHINALNDFQSSLSLKINVEKFLEKIEIHYDTDDLNPIPCSFSFRSSFESNVISHPIERLRTHLHFPEQQLFLNIAIPPHHLQWRSFSFTLYFKEGWPQELDLSKDSFIPFVIPIANLKKEPSQAIKCDGTKDTYSILHSYPDEAFSLHSVLGVYEIEQKSKRSIKSGAVSPGKGSYEIEYLPFPRLMIDDPEAFENPKLISVEALWSQPWFSSYIGQEIHAKITIPAPSGSRLRLIGKFHPHETALCSEKIDFLIRLLSLKNSPMTDLEDILFLCGMLKNISQSYFKDIPDLIEKLEVKQSHLSLSSGAPIRYQFQLKEKIVSNPGLLTLFFTILREVLDSWLPNSGIEFRVSSQLSMPIILKKALQ
jgi:type VI secretion system protein ImpG